MGSHPLAVRPWLPSETTDVRGKLSFVDNSVDANTGTIQLKGLFDNQDQQALAGPVRRHVSNPERTSQCGPWFQARRCRTGSEGSYVFVIDRR